MCGVATRRGACVRRRLLPAVAASCESLPEVVAWPGVYAGTRLVQAGEAMFVIELIYKAPLADIDAAMAAHVKFLKKYYAAGNFLVSGRKIPRDGGIILAVGASRRSIEAIVAEDPFIIHRLAEARIIEFRASQRAADIQNRIERS